VTVAFRPRGPDSTWALLEVDAGPVHGETLLVGNTAFIMGIYSQATGAGFPLTPVRSRSTRGDVIFENHTDVPQTLTTSLRGSGAAAFIKESDTCAGVTLAPHGTCMVSVHFAPRTRGRLSALLTVAGAVGARADILLDGWGE
jgi:hypothetical protein